MTSEIRNLPTPTSEYRVRVHDENRGTERSGHWAILTARQVGDSTPAFLVAMLGC